MNLLLRVQHEQNKIVPIWRIYSSSEFSLQHGFERTGINLKNLKIDVSANYHQTLGISPQIGLTYSFKKTETTSPKIEQ